MIKQDWLTRTFPTSLPKNMLPFYLERLQGTIPRVERKVKDISNETLSNKLDGKWSIKENIAHLAEVDEVSLKRIDEMIRGITPLSSAVVPLKEDYNAQNIQQVINFFTKSRLAKLKRLQSLTETELDASSLHPRLKVNMTPVDLAFFAAEHDDHHLVRVNEIFQSLSV